MRAEIIATGDELIAGVVADTNSSYLALHLRGLGWEVHRISVIPDAEEAIVGALREAFYRSKLVVMTGGLGPTRDDRTREAVARAAGVPLVLDPVLLERLEQFFASRGGSFPATNRKQAFKPYGATPIRNPLGTAPGFILAVGTCSLFAFPGVPRELRAMVEEVEVFPRLQWMPACTIDIVGVSEALLDERLAALRLPSGLQVGTVSGGARISVRLRASLPAELEVAIRAIRKEFGSHVLGLGGKSQQQVVIEEAAVQRLTVACAESCTGGLVCARLTDVPGSSAVVLGGVVAYANSVKVQALGVEASTLEAHGAVSEQVARAMAAGVRARFGASLAVALTGIAGPGGGTPEKPVGLVYVAFEHEHGGYVLRRTFGGNRARVRRASVQTALEMLRRYVLALPDLE